MAGDRTVDCGLAGGRWPRDVGTGSSPMWASGFQIIGRLFLSASAREALECRMS